MHPMQFATLCLKLLHCVVGHTPESNMTLRKTDQPTSQKGPGLHLRISSEFLYCFLVTEVLASINVNIVFLFVFTVKSRAIKSFGQSLFV